uniref:Uncharacterized protein n=1 Tax=Plectus sambesii TaxID=2011161 RepID=A0A914XJH4_9BILA
MKESPHQYAAREYKATDNEWIVTIFFTRSASSRTLYPPKPPALVCCSAAAVVGLGSGWCKRGGAYPRPRARQFSSDQVGPSPRRRPPIETDCRRRRAHSAVCVLRRSQSRPVCAAPHTGAAVVGGCHTVRPRLMTVRSCAALI